MYFYKKKLFKIRIMPAFTEENYNSLRANRLARSPDTCKQFQCNFTIAVTVDSTVPVVFFALIFLTYLPDSQI
jgi:hypothetical protein